MTWENIIETQAIIRDSCVSDPSALARPKVWLLRVVVRSGSQSLSGGSRGTRWGRRGRPIVDCLPRPIELPQGFRSPGRSSNRVGNQQLVGRFRADGTREAGSSRDSLVSLVGRVDSVAKRRRPGSLFPHSTAFGSIDLAAGRRRPILARVWRRRVRQAGRRADRTLESWTGHCRLLALRPGLDSHGERAWQFGGLVEFLAVGFHAPHIPGISYSTGLDPVG